MSPSAEPRSPDHRLDPAERERLDREGFLVREQVLDAAEVARIGEDCEQMVARLCARDLATPRIPAGSYCFQADPALCTILKWEPDHPDVLQGVEPFAHFDPALRGWGMDARFVGPMCDLLGGDVELFTEKLNVKRARLGGPIVLHQDYPYWRANSQDPGEIATVVVFLDDATLDNGCLEVVPGSHRGGVRPGGGKPGFGEFEMEPTSIPDDDLVALEVPAGTAVFFGSLLVHRSAPNRSGGDRRTLLYSYQPAGRDASVVSLAALLGTSL